MRALRTEKNRAEHKTFSAVNWIWGIAAAALMVLGRVNEVYAEKISVSAVALLAKHDIILQYSERVPYITNRDGTGLCPLEQACGSLSEPEDIFYAIQRTLEKMMLNSKTITDYK